MIKNLLFVIASIVSCFLCHELSHLIVFIVTKKRINCIVTPFLTIYRKGRNTNHKITNGFCIIPEGPAAKTRKEYIREKRNYINALAAGPTVSIVYLIISILFLDQAFFRVAVVVNTAIIYNSCRSNCHAVGDIVAVIKILRDESFFLAYAIEWLADGNESIDANNYCFFVLKEKCEQGIISEICITELKKQYHIIGDKLIVDSDDKGSAFRSLAAYIV